MNDVGVTDKAFLKALSAVAKQVAQFDIPIGIEVLCEDGFRIWHLEQGAQMNEVEWHFIYDVVRLAFTALPC